MSPPPSSFSLPPSLPPQGKKLWGVRLPDTITCVEVISYQPRSFRAVLVALKNKEVRMYKDKFLVNTIRLEVRNSPSLYL